MDAAERRVARTCRVEVIAGAPIGSVWRVIADVTRTGEWSHECHHVTWLGGATAAAPGVRFRGRNRSGWLRWTSRSGTPFRRARFPRRTTLCASSPPRPPGRRAQTWPKAATRDRLDAQEALAAWPAVAARASGAYTGFLGPSTDADVAVAYPAATYRRLSEVKQRYDPGNVFRRNPNIRPAGADVAPGPADAGGTGADRASADAIERLARLPGRFS
jgi:Berberine and berberine like